MSLIVQLSDLHLFTDRAGVLAGVETWSTFEAILARVERDHADFDCLVLTGDLAQDEALPTYRMLRERLEPWHDRLRLIPGNHDNRAHLRHVFPEHFEDASEFLGFSTRVGGWQIIGLDSQVPGETYGRVDGAQLHWFERQLEDNARDKLVFVHHPPIPIDVDWLDDIGLDQSGPFVHRIELSDAVKIVCAGHVHQAFEGRIGAAVFYTTPSTCVQFGAKRGERYDGSMAGYRTFELSAGSHRSEVYRLA